MTLTSRNPVKPPPHLDVTKAAEWSALARKILKLERGLRDLNREIAEGRRRVSTENYSRILYATQCEIESLSERLEQMEKTQ